MTNKITKNVFGTKLGKKNKGKIPGKLAKVDTKIQKVLGMNTVGK